MPRTACMKRLSRVFDSRLLSRDHPMIEEVSYWSTFSTARQVLDEVRTRTAHRVLEVVQKTAAELVALGAGTTHALASRVFQRLIADRKFLASYYKSAALLAALLARRLGRDWSDART